MGNLSECVKDFYENLEKLKCSSGFYEKYLIDKALEKAFNKYIFESLVPNEELDEEDKKALERLNSEN